MDDIDSAILKILKGNARITASEISNQINLSVPAVSDRIKKLETLGIIKQYTAIINPERLGKCLTAMMFISLERPRFADKFVEFVCKEDEILECHYLAGDFDYALKIVTDSTSTLESLLNRIKSVSGVQKTRTMIVLSTVKNDYSITPESEKE